jgi:hypothetical protein
VMTFISKPSMFVAPGSGRGRIVAVSCMRATVVAGDDENAPRVTAGAYIRGVTISLDPCRACGGAVTIVQVPDERAAGSALVQRRQCGNSECRMNGPKSRQRFGDRI